MDGAGLDGRPSHHTITLPPAADSPRSARRFLLSVLRGAVDEDTLDSALLLVTELVTNVVVHAGTPAVVDISPTDPGELTIRVRDLHPVRIGASRRGSDDAAGAGGAGGLGEPGLGGLREDGRGLALVDALASSWGTEHGAGGKSVWFRLTATQKPAEAPDEPASTDGTGEHGMAQSGGNVIPITPSPRPAHPAERPGPARLGTRPPAASDPQVCGPTLPSGLPTEPPPASAFPAGHGARPAPAGRGGARPTPVVLVKTDPAPRSPRIISRSTARALTAEGEVAELLGQLVDTQPVTGGLVHRPTPDDPKPEIVTSLGEIGALGDALAIPLDPTQETLGEVLLWPDPTQRGHRGRPGAVDTERVRLVARWMALALGGGDMRQAEERRIGMLSFLAEASDLLAGSLELEHTLTMLAHLPVPRLGRWSAVYLRRDDGNPLLAAVAHAEESAETALSDMATDPAGPVLAAVRGAGTTPVRQVSTPDGPVLVAVLRARRRVLGMVAVGRDPGSSFAADEADLLGDLARRAAFAVDNARLYSRQVELADGLQAGLRPPVLPEIQGLDLGAAYGAA